MSKWDKLIAKILALSTDLRFDEVKKVLEDLGYVEDRHGNTGSHHTFRKINRDSITIPKKDNVKKAYVKMVKKAVEMEMNNEE